MVVPLEWSSNELIEEELLSDASIETVCSWLKKNADTNVALPRIDYFDLRRKYEPIWAASESNVLKISVCLYGRDQKTLKNLFESDLPTHFKEAILTNVSFVRDAGLLSSGYGLIENDICKLYEKLASDPDDPLFFKLFQNPALSAEFIEMLFRKQNPYQNISDQHLLRIFVILCMGRTDNYFAQNQKKYEANNALRLDAQSLANKLIEFIPTIGKIQQDAHLAEFCGPFTTSYIWNFLESTKELDTNGIANEKTLLLFNDQNDDDEKNHDQMELVGIQLELGNRAFSGLLPNGSKKQLLDFANSNYARLRTIYYRNAPLSDIYGISSYYLERFFEDTPIEYISLAADQEDESSNPLPEQSQKAREAITGLLKRDKAIFASALALNERHYQSKHSRMFLGQICMVADSFGTLPWPLGNGMCKDVFQAKNAEIRRKIPAYFADETPESEQAERIDDLSKKLSEISSKINEQINKQSSSDREMRAQIEMISRKLDGQEMHFNQIVTNISDATDFLDLKIKEPNDIISRFLFGIPILGRLLRLLFR